MNDNSNPNTPMESAYIPNETEEAGHAIEVGTHALEPGETNPPQANETIEDDNVDTSPNKLGLKSEAWKHFKREKVDDKWKAVCKYCEKKLDGETRKGTKHLHDHIRSCKLRTVRGPKQSILKTLTQSSSSVEGRSESLLVGNYTFNQEESRQALGQAIVMHGYPLNIVDHEGFRYFLSVVQPLFRIHTRNTYRSDIFKMYEDERGNILKLLERNASRISITTDMWTTGSQNKAYMAVTTHFIDDSWSLQSRLIRFIPVQGKHNAENLGNYLADTLMDWNMDRKISTVTVDNCTTNDAMIQYVLDRLPSSSFILGGSLFHMRCAAHILNLIVKEGMSMIQDAIGNIRESIKYWFNSGPQRQEKFVETFRQLNIDFSKKPRLDVVTRWNSTYLMLASTLPYEEVFFRLKQRDANFDCAPSDDEWKMAYDMVDKLEIFFNVTEMFSGRHYPTSNEYFPKVCEIRVNLHE